MNDKQQLLNEYSEWIGKVKEFGVLKRAIGIPRLRMENGRCAMWCAISCDGMNIFE